MKSTIQKGFFGQEFPVNGPYVEELTTKVERSVYIGDRVGQEKRSAENKLSYLRTARARLTIRVNLNLT